MAAMLKTGTPRALAALAIFAAWAAVTTLFPHLGGTLEAPQSITATVAHSIQTSFAAAIVLLLVCVAVLRWGDVGFALPRARSLRLLWFPALYVVGFFGLALAVGFPSPATMLVILANTLLAGVSEELACRGVLYRGLRARLPLWPAMLASTFLFGAVHVFNGATTGSYGLAAIQAVAAFMTGMTFMAIRVRTGSLYPGMILHGLWDFMLLLTVTGIVQRFGEPDTSLSGISAAALALPLLLVVPNFIYGLYLLRHATRDEAG